jgi:hypothetical protein
MDPTDAHYLATTEYYARALDGHVYLRETLDAFMAVLAGRAERLAHAPRILELGSHAGFITERLLKCWPDASILVSDDDEALVAMSRRRLGHGAVSYHSESLDSLDRDLDFAISVARHHHLPHDYLGALHAMMHPEMVYVLADELCPEYCDGRYGARIAEAEVIHVVGGYVLTTRAEVTAFERTGAIPEIARELEQIRRRALWRWYRFVVDEAVERGYFDIAVGELQSAHDDLITGSDAEHKFSPLIVERQLELAGFRLLSKRAIGPADDVSRQSLFVYEFQPYGSEGASAAGVDAK